MLAVIASGALGALTACGSGDSFDSPAIDYSYTSYPAEPYSTPDYPESQYSAPYSEPEYSEPDYPEPDYSTPAPEYPAEPTETEDYAPPPEETETTSSTDCDPNYSGACVPIASDVDCAGGSGNGPEYVAGPVTVTGTDIYDLDRDGDGTGCDS